MSGVIEEWRNHAACRGVSPDQFFPEKDDGGVHPGVRALCASCPVRLPCLSYALLHEKHGFWGGETARGRRDIRRKKGLGDYPDDATLAARPQRLLVHGTRSMYDKHGCRCDPCRAAKRAVRLRYRLALQAANGGAA